MSDFDADGIWTSLYLPLGALGQAYDLAGYPFDWNQRIELSFVALNNWLKGIAEAAYGDFQFVFGVIGFESGFEGVKKEVLATGVPETRSEGILLPDKDRLRWYPPTYDRHL